MRRRSMGFAGVVRRPWEYLAILALLLSVPISGPVINAHVLEHEAQENRERAPIPHHDHYGNHLEAGPRVADAVYCLYCLSSHGSVLLTAAPAVVSRLLPGPAAPPLRHQDPHPLLAFEPGAPRAPPA